MLSCTYFPEREKYRRERTVENQNIRTREP